MLLYVLGEDIIDAALPAGACGPEVLDNVMVQAQADTILDLGLLWTALAASAFESLDDFRKHLARWTEMLEILGLQLAHFTIVIGQRWPSCR